METVDSGSAGGWGWGGTGFPGVAGPEVLGPVLVRAEETQAGTQHGMHFAVPICTEQKEVGHAVSSLSECTHHFSFPFTPAHRYPEK